MSGFDYSVVSLKMSILIWNCWSFVYKFVIIDVKRLLTALKMVWKTKMLLAVKHVLKSSTIIKNHKNGQRGFKTCLQSEGVNYSFLLPLSTMPSLRITCNSLVRNPKAGKNSGEDEYFFTAEQGTKWWYKTWKYAYK